MGHSNQFLQLLVCSILLTIVKGQTTPVNSPTTPGQLNAEKINVPLKGPLMPIPSSAMKAPIENWDLRPPSPPRMNLMDMLMAPFKMISWSVDPPEPYYHPGHGPPHPHPPHPRSPYYLKSNSFDGHFTKEIVQNSTEAPKNETEVVMGTHYNASHIPYTEEPPVVEETATGNYLNQIQSAIEQNSLAEEEQLQEQGQEQLPLEAVETNTEIPASQIVEPVHHDPSQPVVNHLGQVVYLQPGQINWQVHGPGERPQGQGQDQEPLIKINYGRIFNGLNEICSYLLPGMYFGQTFCSPGPRYPIGYPNPMHWKK